MSAPAPRRINHLGVAVRTLQEGLSVWRDGLGLAVQQIVDLPDRGLTVAFLPCGETMIELLAPLHDGSEISKFLTDRGPGIHHVCLETADIAAASDQAAAAGLKLLGDGPKLGAEGFPVRFLHPKTTAGTLVELLDKPDESSK
jgi:methylmalonyl-CoA epimerase